MHAHAPLLPKPATAPPRPARPPPPPPPGARVVQVRDNLLEAELVIEKLCAQAARGMPPRSAAAPRARAPMLPDP